MFKKIKTAVKAAIRGRWSIDTGLKNWTDQEVLEQIQKFFDRIQIGTEFVEDGKIIVAEQLNIRCGELVLVSPPLPLDWPLKRAPMPKLPKLPKQVVN